MTQASTRGDPTGLDEITELLEELAGYDDDVINASLQADFNGSEVLSDMDAESLFVVLEHIKDTVQDGIKYTKFYGNNIEKE